MEPYRSYRADVYIPDQIGPNNNNWLKSKNGNIIDIGGKTYYVEDDDVTRKHRKLNISKIMHTLYGSLYMKHYLGQFKPSPHLSYFHWMHDIPRYVIWSTQINHKNHYNKLKKMPELKKVSLELPKRFKELDLTPLFDNKNTIKLSITCDKTQQIHNVGWKCVFLLYVIFEMGLVSVHEGGVWYPDPELKDVVLKL